MPVVRKRVTIDIPHTYNDHNPHDPRNYENFDPAQGDVPLDVEYSHSVTLPVHIVMMLLERMGEEN